MLDLSEIRPTIDIKRDGGQQLLIQVWEAPEEVHAEIKSLSQCEGIEVAEMRSDASGWYKVAFRENTPLMARNYAQVLQAKFGDEIVVKDFVNV